MATPIQARRPAGSSPRVRGTRLPGLQVGRQPDGSSPRVRGTLPAAGVRHHPRRFIPACAGNSRRHVPGRGDARRFIPACAGNSAGAVPPRRGPAGSSPRVRGTRRRLRLLRVPIRFIPACAGNSRSITVRRAVRIGSSPRVRGTHRPRRAVRVRRRFIPACAGNSEQGRPVYTNLPVHPRVCGELPGLRGSSPLSRRFIPACAGNSRGRPSCALCLRVHPRVCGELATPPRTKRTWFGSSPRVRGTLGHGQRPDDGRRFIPACAGNSPGIYPNCVLLDGSSPRVRGTRIVHARRGRSSAVHPRVCGELAHPKPIATRLKAEHVMNRVGELAHPKPIATRG